MTTPSYYIKTKEMSKITINPFISNSRIIANNPTKYTVASTQVADFLINKRGSQNYHVVYLPMEYHCQNPGYIAHKLDKVME